jgi:Ca2+/H+ antiporter
MLKKDSAWLGVGLCLLVTALGGGIIALVFSLWDLGEAKMAKTLIFAFIPPILMLRYYAKKKFHNTTKGVVVVLLLLFALFLWQVKL